MKFLTFLPIAFLCIVSDVFAQERGIGVSPSSIEIEQRVEWPYTVALTVTNLSSETENFEVTFEKDADGIVSSTPGRFSLESLARSRVLVTFEEPRHETEGLVKVVSIRTSADGFTTGTGVKIPFHIEARLDNTKFFAGVREAFGGFLGFHQLFGAGMILITIILLWQIAQMISPWIFSSNKQ